MVPAAHITTVSGPAARWTAPITCWSVGRALSRGAAVSGSTLANQSDFRAGEGAGKTWSESLRDSASSPTRASQQSGSAPCLTAS